MACAVLPMSLANSLFDLLIIKKLRHDFSLPAVECWYGFAKRSVTFILEALLFRIETIIDETVLGLRPVLQHGFEGKDSASSLLLMLIIIVGLGEELDTLRLRKRGETFMVFPDFFETISIVIILIAFYCPPFRRTDKWKKQVVVACLYQNPFPESGRQKSNQAVIALIGWWVANHVARTTT